MSYRPEIVEEGTITQGVVRAGVYETRVSFSTHELIFRVQETIAPDDIMEHQVVERIFHLMTNGRDAETRPIGRDVRRGILEGTRLGI